MRYLLFTLILFVSLAENLFAQHYEPGNGSCNLKDGYVDSNTGVTLYGDSRGDWVSEPWYGESLAGWIPYFGHGNPSVAWDIQNLAVGVRT